MGAGAKEMLIHKVEQGEHLTSVAKRYGFSDWRSVYEHPGNVELRARRPNPDVLLPGDRVAIPEKKRKAVPAATEQRHRFIRMGTLVMLRFVVKDPEERVLGGARYELRIGD